MSEPTLYPYSPGLDDVPCAKSSICFIDGQKGILSYRGYSIEELAQHSNFMETSYLLLKGRLPTRAELDAFVNDIQQHRRLKYRIVDVLKCLPDNGHPMDALDTAVSATGMFYPAKHIEDADARYWACVRLIAKLPTMVAAFHRLRFGDEHILPSDSQADHASNFLYMLSGKEADPYIAKVLDTCFVLHAEHSMNASTFTARLAAFSADGITGDKVPHAVDETPSVGSREDRPINLIGNVNEWVDASVPEGIDGDCKDDACRVIRGGSYLTSEPKKLTGTYRNWEKRTEAASDLGFRCAADAQ